MLSEASPGSWLTSDAELQEDKLGAAVLLEQAAHLELLCSPPARRKYAFHTVLAGLSYNGCGQARLGMHAYRYPQHQGCSADVRLELQPGSRDRAACRAGTACLS